jgi:hypothetical protein
MKSTRTSCLTSSSSELTRKLLSPSLKNAELDAEGIYEDLGLYVL